jgi:hypothetical protein
LAVANRSRVTAARRAEADVMRSASSLRPLEREILSLGEKAMREQGKKAGGEHVSSASGRLEDEGAAVKTRSSASCSERLRGSAEGGGDLRNRTECGVEAGVLEGVLSGVHSSDSQSEQDEVDVTEDAGVSGVVGDESSERTAAWRLVCCCLRCAGGRQGGVLLFCARQSFGDFHLAFVPRTQRPKTMIASVQWWWNGAESVQTASSHAGTRRAGSRRTRRLQEFNELVRGSFSPRSQLAQDGLRWSGKGRLCAR